MIKGQQEPTAARCDFCGRLALYDAKTKLGPWAYVCQLHFDIACCHTKGLYTKLTNAEDSANNNKED